MRSLWWALSVSICSAATALAPPATGTLVVSISGVQPERGGDLIVLLYDRGEAWLKPPSARARVKVAARGATGRAEIPDLLYSGTYAVEVFHDANGNGVLDRRTVPIPLPLEGTGTSNNQRRMGPPLYEAARVTLDRGHVTVEIALRYF